jgi:hypothetical protein
MLENAMERRALLSLSLGLPLLAACQTSVEAEQTTTAVGVIETVDPTAREILLRGQGGAQTGALITLVVGNAVRINQLRAGDRVTVRYFQAIAARVARPRSEAETPFAGAAIERNATRPGGEVTIVRSGRVTITAVDNAAGSVSFVGPGGITRTVFPKNPEVQSFVRTLRVGERVDIVYEEAFAITVDPMR